MKKALGFGLALLMVAAPCAMAGASSTHVAPGYLGVDVRDIAPDQVGPLKLKDTHGAEIVLVDHDAPAGKCGLREHDVVLTMNGQAIEGQDQLRHMLRDSPPGRTIVLVVSHDGQQRTVTTQMAVSQEAVEREATEQRLAIASPAASSSGDSSEESALGGASLPTNSSRGDSLLGPMVLNPSYTGLYLENMSAQLAGYFGAANGTGLLVRSVQPNSPAALAGMHAGDVVMRADGKIISNTSAWAKAIKNSHGRSLSILVLRDKKEETLTLKPDGKRRSSLLQPDSIQPHREAAPIAVARVGYSWMPLY